MYIFLKKYFLQEEEEEAPPKVDLYKPKCSDYTALGTSFWT